MANFSRKDYEAQKAANPTTSSQSKDRVDITFMGSLLNTDGASVVVRFPYHSMDDIVYSSVHTVMDYPGALYGKKIQCEGDGCPLCAAGIKKEMRVLIKLIAYVQEGNVITPKVVLWDRPSAFADIDLKDAFDNYGDLSTRLFKIKRSGVKMNTRYSMLALDKDHAIYNATTCPADFTALESVDADKIMTKTYEQYQKALHPETAQEAPVTAAPVHAAPVQQAEPAPAQPVYQAPVQPTPTYQAPVQEAPKPAAEATRAKRYTF